MLRNPTTTFSNDAEDQGLLFWETVKSNFRSLIVQRRFLRRRIIRLTLTGISSHDPNLLNALRSTMDELLPPNHNEPRAARVVLSGKELERNHKEEDKHREGFSSHYNDHSLEWIFKDYEGDLLALVNSQKNQNDEAVDIDASFKAARGAALLGLASRILSCEHSSKKGRYLHFPGWDEYQDEISDEYHSRLW